MSGEEAQEEFCGFRAAVRGALGRCSTGGDASERRSPFDAEKVFCGKAETARPVGQRGIKSGIFGELRARRIQKRR